MVCQGLCQSLVECGMFHVDNHAMGFLGGDEFRHLVGFFLGRDATHRNVPGAIGEDDQQRHHIGVEQLFTAEHIVSHLQTC